MYKDKILKLLASSRTGFVSGEDLAAKLGISRTMVWKHIKALGKEGLRIEAVPSKGYRLMAVPDVILLDELKQGLRTKVIGKYIHLRPEVESTNALAAELAQKGAPEGTVVIAESQSGGKGRLGRTWISPKGNLYLSVILRPNIAPHKAPLLTLMGAVAVAVAIRKHTALQASIKWPNDIFLAGKKAGGLLTEMSSEPDRIRHIVIGIGVDVNMAVDELPAQIRPSSTTIAAEKGEAIDRTALLQVLINELDHFLNSEAAVLKEWEELNVTTGKRVVVSGGGETLEGSAEGIDSEGRLILKLDDGTLRRVAAGDVTILKNREMKNAE
jgi:BirA family transcriptional regulator, biotin operon repressor / biotin---[acetyl-CoA-carboxylase] ligase